VEFCHEGFVLKYELVSVEVYLLGNSLLHRQFSW